MGLFFRRKKQEPEIEEIRNEIIPRKIVMPADSLPKQFPELEKYDPKKPELPLDMPEKEETTPLFVKVDNYREILMHVRDLKAILFDLKKTVELHKSIEDIRAQNIKLLERAVNEFNKIADKLDNQLVRPEKLPSVPSNVDRMDTYISELENDLNRLRDQIEK